MSETQPVKCRMRLPNRAYHFGKVHIIDNECVFRYNDWHGRGEVRIDLNQVTMMRRQGRRLSKHWDLYLYTHLSLVQILRLDPTQTTEFEAALRAIFARSNGSSHGDATSPVTAASSPVST